jgi:flavodoxin
MTALVLYSTRKGTTRLVADAIADGIRTRQPAEVRSIDEPLVVPPGTDLLVLGGPTEGHGPGEPMKAFLETLTRDVIEGRQTASFDTRLHWPRWMSGSAADGIRERLESLGAPQPVPTESFIVTMRPDLEDGELERARAWGVALVALVKAAEPVAAG